MQKLCLYLITTVVLLCGVVLIAGSSSPASAECLPGRSVQGGIWTDGFNRTPGFGYKVNGVRSWIWGYDPRVHPDPSQTPGNPASAAWVLLRAQDPGLWTQIGWVEEYDEVRWTWIQYKFGPSLNDIIDFKFPPKPEQTFTEYRVDYWGYFQYFAGTSGYGTLPAYFEPIQASVFGEIKNYATQMPGGYQPNYRQHFLLSQINYAGGWQGLLGLPYTNAPTEFGYLSQSAYNYAIWDMRCPQ